LAGGLKRELKEKYFIRPKVRHAYGELEVVVNDRSVFSYKRMHQLPTVERLMALVEDATKTNPLSVPRA
jgi:hypothetical protein